MGKSKSLENLIPSNKRTPRERSEIARKGAEATNQIKREKKKLKELLEIALALPGKTGDRAMDITNALVNKAVRGDTKAYEIIRDTIGEKPREQIDTTITYEDRLREAEDEEEY